MTPTRLLKTSTTVLAVLAAAAFLIMPAACAQAQRGASDADRDAMQNDQTQNERMDQNDDQNDEDQGMDDRDADEDMNDQMKSEGNRMDSQGNKAMDNMQNDMQSKADQAENEMDQSMNRMQDKMNQADKGKSHGITKAIAVLEPTQGNDAQGTVHLTKQDGKVKIVAEVRGLEPNSVHAIHIHQYGDVSSKDGKAAGGHYNPEDVKHALPKKDKRHAGDLGNLTKANDQGVARKEITVKNITIAGQNHPVLGRAVIVHAKKDDGGQPTGHAGARIAQGVIGVDQSK